MPQIYSRWSRNSNRVINKGWIKLKNGGESKLRVEIKYFNKIKIEDAGQVESFQAKILLL